MELPGGSGFDLAESASIAGDACLFLTTRHDPASVTRGFEVGAADYLLKPASAEIVAAKVHRIIEGTQTGQRAVAAGVSGSLREMALPELVQIMSTGRKSGVLSIYSGDVVCSIGFSEGMIHEASFRDLAGEQAIFQIMRIVDGDFQFDPQGKVGENTINRTTDFLLLEAFRLLDEEQQG
ncbi:MAG: DUF4388 domain-containing protein [Polyangiales bacterium]